MDLELPLWGLGNRAWIPGTRQVSETRPNHSSYELETEIEETVHPVQFIKKPLIIQAI